MYLRLTRSHVDPVHAEAVAQHVPGITAALRALPGVQDVQVGIDRATGRTLSLTSFETAEHAPFSRERLSTVLAPLQALGWEPVAPEIYEAIEEADRRVPRRRDARMQHLLSDHEHRSWTQSASTFLGCNMIPSTAGYKFHRPPQERQEPSMDNENMFARPGLSRRATLGGVGLGAAALGLAGLQSTAAQDATPATVGHPLVGTWFLDDSSANPTDARDLFILHADGTYVEANADGSVRLGAWKATSPTTANLTIVADTRDEDGADVGGQILRLAITLNPDGTSYTAEGTLELRATDGTLSGQAGPVRGAATRLVVEAPETPVMTLDELFGGAAGATEATPAT